MSKKKYDPPTPEESDIAHKIARTGIASIPVVGGAAAELFTTLITPSLEKRRQEWMEEIAEGLRELEANSQLNINELQDNENFITVLMHANQAAMRNHQKEKIEALHVP